VRRRPDIAAARRLLGWEPRIDVVEGLQRTIAYFRTQAGEGRDTAGAAAPVPA
jgi:nucleoside-diphosphate-sugar epimerase